MFRRHSPWVAVLLLTACAGSDKENDTPTPETKTPAAPEGDAKGEDEDGANEPETASGPTALIGFLQEEATRRCKKGTMETVWVNEHLEVGFVTVSNEVADADPLIDSVVLARGRVDPNYSAPEVKGEFDPCPVPQMRSDWVESKNGMRIRRPSVGIPAFHVEAFEPVAMAVKRDGDDVVVTWTNPLDVPIRDAVITMHYEGCYGKPGSNERDVELGEVAAKAESQTRFPAVEARDNAPKRKGGPWHRATSVVLTGAAEGAAIDLDAPLSALGTSVVCPEK